jgi:hypothetical protein
MPEPLTCDDLIDRQLANEAHCCKLCHDPELAAFAGSKMRAVVIRLPDGDVEAELCCSQALTVDAHEIIGRAVEPW